MIEQSGGDGTSPAEDDYRRQHEGPAEPCLHRLAGRVDHGIHPGGWVNLFGVWLVDISSGVEGKKGEGSDGACR